jgi:hypothetical protein
VPGVRADHEHDAAPPDHPAALTHRLYGRSYLHRPFWVVSIKNLREKARSPHESGDGHNKKARRPTKEYSNRPLGACARSDALIDAFRSHTDRKASFGLIELNYSLSGFDRPDRQTPTRRASRRTTCA